MLTNNIAYGSGGGIYASSPPQSTPIANSTIWGSSGGGFYLSNPVGGTVTVTNNIFWGNGTEIGAFYPASLSVTYSDVQGGYTGTGNINGDPLFVGGNDYRLVSGSSCIDSGNPHSSYNDACLPPSMGGSRNDMGAYGGPGACCWDGSDGDGDGYPSVECGGEDCDDGNPNIHPMAKEIAGNGIDEDCDGYEGYCFIATAAFGGELEGGINVLRSFRDTYLMTNHPGAAFVAAYYRYSPPVADYIAERDWLRRLVRTMLLPVVGAAFLFV